MTETPEHYRSKIEPIDAMAEWMTREELIAAYKLAAMPARERTSIYRQWWPRFKDTHPKRTTKSYDSVVLALPAWADQSRLAMVRRMVAKGCQSSSWLARETGMADWLAERYLELAQRIEKREVA